MKNLSSRTFAVSLSFGELRKFIRTSLRIRNHSLQIEDGILKADAPLVIHSSALGLQKSGLVHWTIGPQISVPANLGNAGVVVNTEQCDINLARRIQHVLLQRDVNEAPSVHHWTINKSVTTNDRLGQVLAQHFHLRITQELNTCFGEGLKGGQNLTARNVSCDGVWLCIKYGASQPIPYSSLPALCKLAQAQFASLLTAHANATGEIDDICVHYRIKNFQERLPAGSFGVVCDLRSTLENLEQQQIKKAG